MPTAGYVSRQVSPSQMKRSRSAKNSRPATLLCVLSLLLSQVSKKQLTCYAFAPSVSSGVAGQQKNADLLRNSVRPATEWRPTCYAFMRSVPSGVAGRQKNADLLRNGVRPATLLCVLSLLVSQVGKKMQTCYGITADLLRNNSRPATETVRPAVKPLKQFDPLLSQFNTRNGESA